MNDDQHLTSPLGTASEGKSFRDRISNWSAKNPVLAIALVSLLAVTVNCYPVMFCGRSFVSPALVQSLVYDSSSPLPGMKPTVEVPAHGSDTYATMLWAVPAGFIESRSLLEYGELPLWNRYGHAGDAFIGQAVTMLGDPLQLIVIFGRGSAVAWDLKFLAAKFLFCVGFGLLVLRLLESRPLSLLFAMLAAYCGAFFYINNHPVFFVFSYAPLILLSALALLDLKSKQYVLWGLIWLVANFGCFNGGHVEVAVVLIGGLNLAAVACALISFRNTAEQAKVLGRMAVATLLLLGLTAPVWLSFLVQLQGSYSSHAQVRIMQIPFRLFPGIFDDLYYQLSFRNDSSHAAIAPGSSLLVFVGCILSVLRWRQVKSIPFYWVNIGAIVLWAGCVFGWVPAALLNVIPLLNRVGHTYTDFSYLLVVHLTIQSAYGFMCLAKNWDFRRAVIDFIWVALLFAGMLLQFCHASAQQPIPWNYFLSTFLAAIGAPLLFSFLRSRYHRMPATGWVGICLLGLIVQFRFGLYSFGNGNLLMVAGPRAVLNAPSPAIDKIKMDQSGPYRVIATSGNVYGDYAAVYGLEDIRSCCPLSNGAYIGFIRNFPGINFVGDWTIVLREWVNSGAALAAARPLLNLLNVKYVLAPLPFVFDEQLGYRLVDRSDFVVMENPGVWPRAFFTDKAAVIPTDEEFIQALLKNGKQPFVAFTDEEITQEPGLLKLEDTRQATVTVATHYQLLPNSTAFDIHATAAGVVCLAEGQAKDFTATANNKSVQVLTVNRFFKGVYLDQPGDYHIQFTYRPRYWRVSCALFWISTGIVIALMVMSIYDIRHRSHDRTTS